MTPRLKKLLFYLFHPWLLHRLFEDYDKEWDEALNNLLDTNPQVSDGHIAVDIGGMNRWLGNWPYSFGYRYGYPKKQASRLTKQRLRDYVKASGANICGLNWI